MHLSEIDINWILIGEIAYLFILIAVCLRIIYDTRSTTKTLAYLLFAIFLPVIGIVFYFSFGINYRKNKMYSKKFIENDELATELTKRINHYSLTTINDNDQTLLQNKELARMLLKDSYSPLTSHNSVKLLINGEEKFPEVLKQLETAKDHIHIEYYIYEDDEIGRALEEMMIKKAKEGVTVRFIYDDFGSRGIRKRLANRLRENGVYAYPFLEITFIALANRLNYRNHRKIIVIDGKKAFLGGINISDKYINSPTQPNKLYWRDTHLFLEGPGVLYLQYLFFCDWVFCSGNTLTPSNQYFPSPTHIETIDNKIVQIAASGPDSDTPAIMFSLIQAINLAEKEILITSPYFIPGESLLDALIIAALSGIHVKLLVPGISDSVLVNFAARSYYTDLLNAGVEIYRYQKGFVHAKTMVTDSKVAVVGTANMDFRSFDLNFEVNAIVYDKDIATSLRESFYEDLQHSEKIDLSQWVQRPKYVKLAEKTARLLSPLL